MRRTVHLSTGDRTVLTRLGSAFTIATGAAFNYVTMLLVRFLFGMGEAGAWPCVARSFSRWIPRKDRGTIQGIFFAGAHLAGGLTPLAIVALQPYLHWRLIFVCFGSVGFPPGLEPEAATPVSPRARVARAEDSRLKIDEIPRELMGRLLGAQQTELSIIENIWIRLTLRAL